MLRGYHLNRFHATPTMLTVSSPPPARVEPPPAVDLDPLKCPPPGELHARRHRTLTTARQALGNVGAVILTDPLDIQYLTGTREGISWLVLTDDSAFAVSRHMLVSEVRAEAVDCEILLASARSTERPDLEGFVINRLTSHPIQRVAVDPAKLSALSYFQLAAHATTAGIELCRAPDLLANVRAIKNACELDLTRRCVDIAETAFRNLLAKGAASLIGRSEREIAKQLETLLWDAGADRQGFPGTGIIVASGPNSASAHHAPGNRRINAGEPVLIDWGAELSGYRSDLTRTVFTGSVPEFAQNAYPVVERALHLAAALLRDGAPMGEIDRAGRETIIAAGYPEFHYGIGHGVGLAIHEAPWLRADSTEPCKAGMLTTVEPGIYLHGTGGIRIENLYQITQDGAERLGSLPTNLESMVLA